MTRHGSYWNNIIITRVATSFFRVNLRQGRHRIRLRTIVYMRFGMYDKFKKKRIKNDYPLQGRYRKSQQLTLTFQHTKNERIIFLKTVYFKTV